MYNVAEYLTIVNIIRDSFSDTQLPDDSEQGIFQEYDPMIPAFMTMIKGKSWNIFLLELEKSDYYWSQSYGEMCAYMTPEAFHYFAPAMLIFSMDKKADTLPGLFFGQLYPWGPDSVKQYIQARIDQFSDRQKHAIALVVDHYYGSGNNLTQFASDLQDYWASWR